MRQLNLDELIDKITDYSSDIEYVDKKYLSSKITQFWNFLYEQQISKRIFERLEEDYSDFKQTIFEFNQLQFNKHASLIREKLTSFELQGVFAYFVLSDELKKSRRLSTSELDLTKKWFVTGGRYDEIQEAFNEYIFKPFIKLIEWYLYESQTTNANDYFSKKEVDDFEDKLDQLLNDVRMGQKIIFDEIQDLKDQLKNLKKKNWGELLKGKLFDLALSKVISVDTFSMIVKTVTGEELKILS